MDNIEITSDSENQEVSKEQLEAILDFFAALIAGKQKGFVVAAHVAEDGKMKPFFLSRELCKKCLRGGIMKVVEDTFERDNTFVEDCSIDEDKTIKKPSPYFKKL